MIESKAKRTCFFLLYKLIVINDQNTKINIKFKKPNYVLIKSCYSKLFSFFIMLIENFVIISCYLRASKSTQKNEQLHS